MPQNRKPEKFTKDWVKFGGIGVEMLASVLIGAFGGYGLDLLLKTRPWLMIVGFILGSVAGFRSIFRLLQQDRTKKD
ncbi:MAG: AtpZ/AtpI family protein [Desulfobacterota bacterium]|nr:AtpZ/AtpI family protein [Thermodesulfobacteriota bacterium]